MIVAFQPGPGARVVAFWCDDLAEFDELVACCERGELSFDGNHATALDSASDRAALFARFNLVGPYVPPPLVLRFEDIAVAVRIGETGWYTFDGGLYQAFHRGDGDVVLDRVYESEPPPQYHGRALSDHPTLERKAAA